MPSEPKPYNEMQNVTQQGHAGFFSKEGRSFYLGSVNLWLITNYVWASMLPVSH